MILVLPAVTALRAFSPLRGLAGLGQHLGGGIQGAEPADTDTACQTALAALRPPAAAQEHLVTLRPLRTCTFALIFPLVTELTGILGAIEQGDPRATRELLPLVYEDLRRLAARKLGREAPGQTLSPTALVHEAYLRLVGKGADQHWENGAHFFAAAAESMRRILIENARRKRSSKRGGHFTRQQVDAAQLAAPEPNEDVLALDEALHKFAVTDKTAAELVQLRYFAGLTLPEAAEALGISSRTATRLWSYARAWLHREIQGTRSHDQNS